MANDDSDSVKPSSDDDSTPDYVFDGYQIEFSVKTKLMPPSPVDKRPAAGSDAPR